MARTGRLCQVCVARGLLCHIHQIATYCLVSWGFMLGSFSHFCKVFSGLDLAHKPHEIFIALVCQLLKFFLMLFQPRDLVPRLVASVCWHQGDAEPSLQ